MGKTIKTVEYAGLAECGACGCNPMMNAEDVYAQVLCYCGVRGQVFHEDINPSLSYQRRIELAAITWNAMWRRRETGPGVRKFLAWARDHRDGLTNAPWGVEDAVYDAAIREFDGELHASPLELAPDA